MNSTAPLGTSNSHIPFGASQKDSSSQIASYPKMREGGLGSDPIEKPKAEVLLFDSDPIRRHIWERLCQKESVPLQAFGFVSDRHLLHANNSRVVIFDQSALELSQLDALSLIPKLSWDAIAFSFKNCQVALAAKMISAGACWVFDNGFLTSEIEEGFNALLRQADELGQQVKNFQRVEAIRAKFTPGERDVLELVIQGMPNKLIAKKLDISTRTVETRRSKVYRKCQVQNVTELVRFVDHANALKAKFQR